MQRKTVIPEDANIAENQQKVMKSNNDNMTQMRELWDKQKILKSIPFHIEKEVQAQAKNFAYILWGIIFAIILINHVLVLVSNGRWDLSNLTLPVILLLSLVTWSRLLVLGEKIQVYTYITFVGTNVAYLWGLWIVRSLRNGFVLFYSLLYTIIYPPAFFAASRVANTLGQTLLHEYKEQMQSLSTVMSSSLLGLAPAVMYIALDAFGISSLNLKSLDDVCELLPGAVAPVNTDFGWYKNCTIDKIELYYLQDVTPNTTIMEIELRNAIEAYIPGGPKALATMLQACLLLIFWVNSQILVRVCRLSIRDVYALRTTFWEMTLLIASVLDLIVLMTGSSLDMAPRFDSPRDYLNFAYYVILAPSLVLLFIILSAMYMLILQGKQVVELEMSKEYDPEKYRKSCQYRAVWIIHKRGMEMGKAKSKRDVEEFTPII